MKKLFLLLALCGMMVSCGGEQKKEESNKGNEQKKTEKPEGAGEQKGEQPESADEQQGEEAEQLTVAQLFDAMYDALMNDDEARFVELAVTANAWDDELTPEQEKELEAYFNENPEKMLAVIEAVQEIDFDELVPTTDEEYADEDYGYDELSVEETSLYEDEYADVEYADVEYADVEYADEDEWSDEDEW